MAIGGLDRAGFDAMVDFVQQSYEQLEVGTLDTLQQEEAKQFEAKKEELVKQLDGSIREASAQKHKPVEKLLKDMRGAVRTALPDSKANPGIIQHFEREGEKARAAQDTFSGKDGTFQLPAVFGEALGFLKNVFGEKPVAPKAEVKPGEVPAPTATPTTRPELTGQTAPTERDPRVTEFVRTYFGDHFDAAPVKAKENATALPKAEREAFDKLPKEEKAFLQTLKPAEKNAYAAMPKEEQTFFRAMKPSERGQFQAMTPDERKYFRDLNPDQRAAYLTLHPDQRAKVREQGVEGRKALTTQPEVLKGTNKQSPVEVARTVSSDALKLLGFQPPKEGQDTKSQAATLMEKTQTLMMNFMAANPGNVAAARVQTLKALLETPELQNALMQDLEGRLQKTDQQKGAKKASYAEHFKKIRPLVLQHAEKLLRPDLDRDTLLSGLEKAVEVSAEFAAAHPPRKRDLRASKNLSGGFRFITG